jgi:myo-inositol-1(or 4)-monophosphatase
VTGQQLLEIAVEAARRAGELLLERFQHAASGVSSKSGPTDLVSDADRDAEGLLVALISKHRPDDGFLAEEGSSEQSKSGIRWVLDPLDGTVNFLHRIPQWAVSIAAEDAQGAVAGVVHDANRAETFTAVRGGGAYVNGAPIAVSDCTELARAVVATGFAYDQRIRDAQAEVARKVSPLVADIRRFGSAALDFSWVAAGRLDAYYESYMGPWDRAAGVLIAQEAGAVASDLFPPFGDGVGCLVANATLHDRLRPLVLGG